MIPSTHPLFASLRLGVFALLSGAAFAQPAPGRGPDAVGVRAVVQPHGGVPTLHINGRAHPGFWFMTRANLPEYFRDFAGAGVDLFGFITTPAGDGWDGVACAWTAPDRFDFSEIDRRVAAVLAERPGAFIYLQLDLYAPQWWCERNPDDVILHDPGDGKPVPLHYYNNYLAASWASDRWRRDLAEGCRRLEAHIAAAPYADRIIGYHLCSGDGGREWMWFGANASQATDFSPVNRANYGRWLRANYRTEAALRTAWGDPQATFESAVIPTKAARQGARLGAWRDPAREQPVIDFYRYHAELPAETIAYFARELKAASGRRKVVGAYYGYTLQLAGPTGHLQETGHLGLGRLLDCPDIDFLASPTSYAYRQVGGTGTSFFMAPTGSVRARGKLWVDENDIRTSLAPVPVGQWGRPANVAGDLLQIDKEAGHCLTEGVGHYWFDIGFDYHHPEIMARIKDRMAAAAEASALSRAPVDEIAAVQDEESFGYVNATHPLAAWLTFLQIPALHRAGAPVGQYLLDDVGRIKNRKLFLFFSAFAPDARERRAVDELKRDGHVLVFVGPAGLYRNGKLDPAGMEALTGIRLKISPEAAPLQVAVASGGTPWTEWLNGAVYGVPDAVSPAFFAEDPAATTLGTLPGGRAGLVVKKFPTWTSVWSAAPLLPARLLRNIAKAARVHLYIDTEDVVWASENLLGISVQAGGSRTIRLPRAMDVKSLYDGKGIGKTIREFQAEFADLQTRVFTTLR